MLIVENSESCAETLRIAGLIDAGAEDRGAAESGRGALGNDDAILRLC
jgi:hypothetical protein